MIISQERQSHLAHLLLDGIWGDDLVDYPEDDEEVYLRIVKQAIAQWVQEHDNLDEMVRNKVSSLKRGVIEGSPEWDVLYRKYMDEEMNRRG